MATASASTDRTKLDAEMKVVVVSGDVSLDDGHPANIGDAFLADRLAGAIEARGHSAAVVDFGVGVRSDTRPRLRVRSVLNLWKIFREADLVVVGGGTLLQDEARGILRAGMPRMCFIVSTVCRLARTRLVFFGVGCDPIQRPISRALLRGATVGRRVWVRDQASVESAWSDLRCQAHLAADVCLLEEENLPDSPSPTHSSVVIALNYRDAPQLDSTSLNRLSGPLTAVFINMHQRAADIDSGTLGCTGDSNLEISPAPTSWTAAYRLISSSQHVVASRMHALYMAALADRPMIAVGTSAKVRSFADEFNVVHVPTVEAAGAAKPVLVDREALSAARERLQGALTEALGVALRTLESK